MKKYHQLTQLGWVGGLSEEPQGTHVGYKSLWYFRYLCCLRPRTASRSTARRPNGVDQVFVTTQAFRHNVHAASRGCLLAPGTVTHALA
jgi:hypothetical protein